MRLVHILRAGTLDYANGLKLQQKIAAQINEANRFKNILILTSHPPVYTIGIRTTNYTINDEERLRKLGAQFFKTNRGGLITFHGPGQMVVYPILNLKDFKPSMRWYVCHIEKTIIDLCKEFGISANTSADTGVWVGDKKICAIGVHGSRYITTHGLALNCNTDLKWFDHIVPCGIEGKGVTSVSCELNRDVSIDEVEDPFLRSFSKIFECQFEDLDVDDKLNFLS
ncbi:putative lipoyltransferase 2, mitochondrial [Bradysia coprophila]|uniref:putative lipoyltransferase 2, mitochondrial n=1 Tax=Bradysia coprophila TaxID=38358 RepID=UPI00187DC79D|nr:putative lipoyltransferase 2, mitochondrial [Bradysia coprophila]